MGFFQEYKIMYIFSPGNKDQTIFPSLMNETFLNFNMSQLRADPGELRILRTISHNFLYDGGTLERLNLFNDGQSNTFFAQVTGEFEKPSFWDLSGRGDVEIWN